MEDLSEELKISGADMFMNISDVKSKDNLGMIDDDDLNIEFEISNPFDNVVVDKNAHKNETSHEQSTSSSSSYLGAATAKTTSGITKSSDGYSKINDIPLEISKAAPINTIRERKRKKMIMLRKLDSLFDAGKIKNRIDKNASYEDIEDEYANAQDDIKSGEYLKMTRSFFLNFIQLTEFVNGTFNPFDFDLDGLHDTVSDDIENYDDAFIEINQKYSNVKLAPEVVVLYKLAFTACMINFGNKALYDNVKQAPTANSSTVLSMMNSMMGNTKNVQSTPLSQTNRDTYTYNPSIEPTNNRGSFIGSGSFSGFAAKSNNLSTRNSVQEEFNTDDADPPDLSTRSKSGKDILADIPPASLSKNYPLYANAPTSSLKLNSNNNNNNNDMGFEMDNESVSMTSTTKKAKRPYRRRQSEKNTIDLDI